MPCLMQCADARCTISYFTETHFQYVCCLSVKHRCRAATPRQVSTYLKLLDVQRQSVSAEVNVSVRLSRVQDEGLACYQVATKAFGSSAEWLVSRGIWQQIAMCAAPFNRSTGNTKSRSELFTWSSHTKAVSLHMHESTPAGQLAATSTSTHQVMNAIHSSTLYGLVPMRMAGSIHKISLKRLGILSSHA